MLFHMRIHACAYQVNAILSFFDHLDLSYIYTVQSDADERFLG